MKELLKKIIIDSKEYGLKHVDQMSDNCTTYWVVGPRGGEYFLQVHNGLGLDGKPKQTAHLVRMGGYRAHKEKVESFEVVQ